LVQYSYHSPIAALVDLRDRKCGANIDDKGRALHIVAEQFAGFNDLFVVVVEVGCAACNHDVEHEEHKNQDIEFRQLVIGESNLPWQEYHNPEDHD
jgi:hypothetical protein